MVIVGVPLHLSENDPALDLLPNVILAQDTRNQLCVDELI